MADKYTRSKVRRALPKDFSYIIEELLHVHESTPNRKNYHQGIIDAIIEEGQAEAFIGVLCSLISRLAVDHLHILGDIFDRGDGPHRILDILQTLPNVDICWGNHDILWMGANLGNPLCVATAVRFSLRYNHPKLLEQGYGIPLRNLFSLAEKLYGQTSCTCFLPIGETTPDCFGIARAQKVICVILWKLELSFCREHPDYEFNLSCTLEHLDQQNRTILCDQTAYPLADADFPTVNPEKPWELTEEEQAVLNGLCESFSDSEKLSGHVRFLIKKGGMYQVMNKNLLYHGCIPMTEDGSFASFLGYRGRSFMDFCDRTVRKAYFLEKGHPEKQFAVDFFWYLFSGKHSPLFGKQEMKTLPGYLISEPSVHRETKNPYYQLIEGEKGRETARMILSEFSLYEEHSKIINGHVPVRTSRGESPKKAGGLLFMIDGGLSPSYYQTTGIGGYTLLYNSHGFFLTAHEPFSKETPEKLRSYRVLGEKRDERIRVADTDTGLLLKKRIRELRRLTGHYRRGILLEK